MDGIKSTGYTQLSALEAERILDRIRPHFQKDGGDIEVIRITDTGMVRIELKGACKVCQVNKTPVKVAVDKLIRDYHPEIQGVVLL